MTDQELDQLMQRVLLDAIKSDCRNMSCEIPNFMPSHRYQHQMAIMIANPLKWARKRARPLWKKVLQRVAVILIVFSLSLGSLMIISPSVRAAVVNWVTEWYETRKTYRLFHRKCRSHPRFCSRHEGTNVFNRRLGT